MAVAVIGSALRARHPRDVCLDPREFSGVVVVFGIWHPTETADNASAVHGGRTCVTVGDAVVAARQVLRALQQSIRSGGLCAQCLPALPTTRVAVFTLRGRRSARRSAPLTMSRFGWDELKFQTGRSAVGGVRLSAGGAGAGVQQPANAVADVGDAVPVWHEIDYPTGPRAVLPPGSPPFVRTEKERRA